MRRSGPFRAMHGGKQKAAEMQRLEAVGCSKGWERVGWL
jgi:hypothetical protein